MKKSIKLGSHLILQNKFCYRNYTYKNSLVIYFKFCQRSTSSWWLKNSMNFKFFLPLKVQNFKFQISLGLNFANRVLCNSPLPLCQLSWFLNNVYYLNWVGKEISEKNLWKDVKPLVKLSREVKQTLLIVEEAGHPSLQLKEKNHISTIVEGGKVDFCLGHFLYWTGPLRHQHNFVKCIRNLCFYIVSFDFLLNSYTNYYWCKICISNI